LIGIINAVSLSSKAAALASGYTPTIIVNTELSNIFNQFADEKDKTRMSFVGFATMLNNFRISPKDYDCTDEGDSDFYRKFMGDSCTDNKPNFKSPQIVRCDGVVIFCQDAGKYRHFIAHDPDSTGLTSLTFYQFK
jgi:hypothetical protein